MDASLKFIVGFMLVAVVMGGMLTLLYPDDFDPIDETILGEMPTFPEVGDTGTLWDFLFYIINIVQFAALCIAFVFTFVASLVAYLWAVCTLGAFIDGAAIHAWPIFLRMVIAVPMTVALFGFVATTIIKAIKALPLT